MAGDTASALAAGCFLRPVAFQAVPNALQEANPLDVPRRYGASAGELGG